MKAIILAGGFGTRLQSVVSNLPKPMATVAGRPFLEHVLDFCIFNTIDEVILSVGYKHELIESHFGTSYKGLKISYAVEHEPLGTGGAIRFALEGQDFDSVWAILNGDTLFSCDLKLLESFFYKKNADMAMALRRMYHFDRYGLVQKNSDDQVLEFQEKQSCAEGLINAGVYILKAGLIQNLFSYGEKFSFEKDFMEKQLKDLNIYGIELEGYFIDIGIPEDYQKANFDLK